LLIDFRAITGIHQLPRQPCQGIQHVEHGKPPVLLGQFQGLSGQSAADADLGQFGPRLVGVVAELGLHCPLDHPRERITALIAFGGQPLPRRTLAAKAAPFLAATDKPGGFPRVR